MVAVGDWTRPLEASNEGGPALREAGRTSGCAATCAPTAVSSRRGAKGVCLVRENRDGTLYTLVYGIPLSQAVDPIEKKPLFHFYPGQHRLFHCHRRLQLSLRLLPERRHLADAPRPGPDPGPPGDTRRGGPCRAASTARRSIAYTYTEPTIFFEYSYDIARLAHEVGIASVYVTNGYMTARDAGTLPGPGQRPRTVARRGQRGPEGLPRRDLQEGLRRPAPAGAGLAQEHERAGRLGRGHHAGGARHERLRRRTGRHCPVHRRRAGRGDALARQPLPSRLQDARPRANAARPPCAGPTSWAERQGCATSTWATCPAPTWRTPSAPTAARLSSSAGASRSDGDTSGMASAPTADTVDGVGM